MYEENQKKTRKKYGPEFKDQVLARAQQDGVAQVARDIGITESMIYAWRAQRKSGGVSLEQQKLEQMELARLKRENARLAMENDFLKKAAAYFAKESKRGTP